MSLGSLMEPIIAFFSVDIGTEYLFTFTIYNSLFMEITRNALTISLKYFIN